MYIPGVNENYCAYIDETGNYGFSFEAQGTSSHFIITAIIVKSEDVDILNKSIDIIRSKFFSEGEMKSSNVSKNHTRRFEILRELVKLDFKVFCLVVDKQKIYEDSAIMDFKKSFMKYLNGILHKELRLLYKNLEIWSDSHGSEEFMIGFDKYINNMPTYSIFDEYKFHFVDSKFESLIQLADIICGTISFGFEKVKKCEEYRGYYSLLKSRIIALKVWPLDYENYLINLDLINKSEFDIKIAPYCLRLATRYIEEHTKSSDPLDRDRVKVLEYILNQMYAYSPNHYIHAKELIDYINSTSKSCYNNQTFTTNIVAGLRDNNVIISSSANGYKIPLTKKELYSYSNITLGMVMPMMERLNKCRQRILYATDNELDILDLDEYVKVKRYFDGNI